MLKVHRSSCFITQNERFRRTENNEKETAISQPSGEFILRNKSTCIARGRYKKWQWHNGTLFTAVPDYLFNFAENYNYMNGRKTDKNLEARLLSGRSVTVVSALEEIKVKGNVAYLPLMFNVLLTNPDEQVENEILKILGSIKVQEAAPVMAEALQSPQYESIRKQLTTACWQNGLDFKNYLPVFVDLVINEEWETGFEAFTVIENMETYPEQELIDLSVAKVEQAMPEASDKKRYFLQEILVLIC